MLNPAGIYIFLHYVKSNRVVLLDFYIEEKLVTKRIPDSKKDKLPIPKLGLLQYNLNIKEAINML